ncbi:MAG: hypothetical protein M3036_16825, partial [Bifidobacteriales bacterium]|nr:hypothetical protein [Bifidobacteriales bacterium]
MVRMNGAFAAAILMTGVSLAHAQEDTLPVRQNVYPNQVTAYPGGYQPPVAYPNMYPMGYPGYPAVGYPGVYPGVYPGGYPGAYPGQQQGVMLNQPGMAGQSVIRDPASGQMLQAPTGAGSNVVVDPSVYMRG